MLLGMAHKSYVGSSPSCIQHIENLMWTSPAHANPDATRYRLTFPWWLSQVVFCKRKDARAGQDGRSLQES